MREFYLSASMLASETGIAYEVSDSYGYRRFSGGNGAGASSEAGYFDGEAGRVQYVVSMAHSQGFDWNQDVFASRYQQMCQVVYDGHVDNLESVLQEWKSRACADESQALEEEEFQSDPRARYVYRRMSDAFITPRRRSDRSISFSADREQGNFKKTQVTVIDVDSDTAENRVLKNLLVRGNR